LIAPAFSKTTLALNLPLLGLGGKKSVDNLDKGDTLTHIYLITELVGKVGIDD